MESVRVLLVDLPSRIHGLTVYNYVSGDACFVIVLNSRLNHETQCRAYRHELEHIHNCDFDSMLPVTAIESLRHVKK